MKRIATTLALLAVLGLGACAEQNGWTPTVDSENDAHPERITKDLAACKQLASKASNQQDNTLESGGIGMVAGAAGGAILGAMVGAPAYGAGLGAAAGAAGGAGTGAVSSDHTYRQVYINCMSKRGHTVLN